MITVMKRKEVVYIDLFRNYFFVKLKGEMLAPLIYATEQIIPLLPENF